MREPLTELDLSTLIIQGYDATNAVYTSQVDPIGGGSSQPAEARHTYGFVGCPNDGDADAEANTTNGAYALTVRSGSTLHALPLDDNRVTATLPPCPKGGSQHYGSKGTASAPSWCQHDGNGNYKIQVPLEGSITFALPNGIEVVLNAQGVQVTGITPAAPMTVGPSGSPPVPVIVGPSAGAWGKPSTVLFATA